MLRYSVLQNKINELTRMQEAYDNLIYATHGTEYHPERCKLALIDELGELTHELKGSWCWWKKTQKPVDRAKTLEELADVYHFLLSIRYHTVYLELLDVGYLEYQLGKVDKNEPFLYSKFITELIAEPNVETLLALTKLLGFTFDEAYDAYKAKNKENYDRVARGY